MVSFSSLANVLLRSFPILLRGNNVIVIDISVRILEARLFTFLLGVRLDPFHPCAMLETFHRPTSPHQSPHITHNDAINIIKKKRTLHTIRTWMIKCEYKQRNTQNQQAHSANIYELLKREKNKPSGTYLAMTVKSLRCLRALRAGLLGWTPFCQEEVTSRENEMCHYEHL